MNRIYTYNLRRCIFDFAMGLDRLDKNIWLLSSPNEIKTKSTPKNKFTISPNL